MFNMPRLLTLTGVLLLLIPHSQAFLGDEYLTPSYLLKTGEHFNDTTFQLIGKAFLDIQETARERLANRAIRMGVGAANMKNNKTLIEHACELMECSKWSKWGHCVATWKHFGYGMVNRTRSCGINTTLCSYPREEHRVEVRTKVCKTKYVRRQCPRSFSKYSAGGETFCLMYKTDDVSQSSAVAACKALGAELVNINSQAKHEAVLDLLAHRRVTIWIDGTRTSTSAPWQFSYDGEKRFGNWNPGEPSNGSSELCNVYEDYPKFRLDRGCSSYYYYVCEYLMLIGPPRHG